MSDWYPDYPWCCPNCLSLCREVGKCNCEKERLDEKEKEREIANGSQVYNSHKLAGASEEILEFIGNPEQHRVDLINQLEPFMIGMGLSPIDREMIMKFIQGK